MVVSDSDKKANVILKSSEEFLEWFFKETPSLKEISFLGESKDVKKMETMCEFLKYYFTVKENCEKKMNEYNKLFVLDDNKFLKEALELFASSNKGGKYLRATLASLGYNCFKDDDKYIPLATSLEIFQTSILIHDDIIDMATLRRGMDTIPIKYEKIYESPIKNSDNFLDKKKQMSSSMALCLGDIGFYFANQIIIKNYFDNLNLSRVLDYYNDMAIKTCKGEMIDVVLPFYEEFYGVEDDLEGHITEIYKLKTAWYSVISPFVLGALLGGASDEEVHKFEDALINLGVSFQIKDDLLNIFGSEKEMGKASFSDVKEFKQTLLYSYTLNTKYKDDLLKLYGKDNLSEKEFNKIRDIFEKSGAKEYCLTKMDKLFKESFEEILDLKIPSNNKKLLLGFAEFLRVLKK